MAPAPAPAPATHRRVPSGGRSNEASRSPRRGSLAGRRGSARRGSALLTTGYAAMFGREDRNVSSTNLLRLARAGRVRRRDWVALGARAWEAVCLLLCIYSVLVVPFGLAFWSEYPGGRALVPRALGGHPMLGPQGIGKFGSPEAQDVGSLGPQDIGCPALSRQECGFRALELDFVRPEVVFRAPEYDLRPHEIEFESPDLHFLGR